MTMVIATHEMGFARDVANRVCFLDRVRILEEGPPSQIFTAPREERTRRRPPSTGCAIGTPARARPQP
jgi:polar amino acid transport system ATP-binding protein